MKQLLISMLLLMTGSSLFSQQVTQPTPVVQTDYLQKSKKQKTAAFIFLGIGATCLAIVAPGNVSFSTVSILGIGGAVSTLVSIPLFISSAKNKRRALKLSFNKETIPQLKNKSLFAALLTYKIDL